MPGALGPVMMAVSLLAVLGRASGASAGKPPEERAPAAAVEAIAPDLALVTEVGTLTPYRGQQLSVIYWLRARRPPSAVDVDPQQFPGFWTEVVPLSTDAGPVVRSTGGQSEYLLRQVVVFPLVEGPAALPPLSFKIRRTAPRPAGGAEWDVRARSRSVTIQVRPLPDAGRPVGRIPMVGEVTGTMHPGAGASQGAVILELEGTANLELFRPEDWLEIPPGTRLRCRLVGSERWTQILDTGGRRRLTLRTRQRWSIEGAPGELRLRVFEPHAGSWSEVVVPRVAVQEGEAPIEAAAGVLRERAAASEKHTGFLPAAVAAAALAILFVLLRTARRGGTARGEAGDLAALERKLHQSPQAFLDAARRAILRHARSRMRGHDLGERDTLLDECWTQITRYRFAGEQPSPEERIELLAKLRVALQPPGRVIAGPEEKARE